MNTIPVTLSNVFAGFGKGDGLLHNEGTHLYLEYQVKDCFVGALKSDVKQLRIPIEDLVSVNLNKGWFGKKWLGVKLVLQSATMESFHDVPGAVQGRIELCIAAKDYDAAEDFVYQLHPNDEAPTESGSRDTSVRV